jgi:hypothetical protein
MLWLGLITRQLSLLIKRWMHSANDVVGAIWLRRIFH